MYIKNEEKFFKLRSDLLILKNELTEMILDIYVQMKLDMFVYVYWNYICEENKNKYKTEN